MSRVLDVEEMREEFLEDVAGLVRFWANVEVPCEEKMSGIVHSILSMLDMGAGGPAYRVIPDMNWADIASGDYEDNVFPPDDISGALSSYWYRAGYSWPRAKRGPN